MLDSDKIFDGLLVLQFRAGNKKALDLLVKRYHKKLCKHAYHYTHDMDSAKDITQECWSIILKKIEMLKDPNLFGSWAFRIVTRKSLDTVNKQRRDFYKRSTLQISSSSEEESFDNEEVIGRLQKALLKLNKDHQYVLRLFYQEEYSLREISHILSISEGTVKSRLFHARERLKLILK